MKKNKMMRVASALLVAVLMTTSVISGTFAKYVTQDKASDEARVAKWGVVLQVAGTLYGENYLATTNTATNDTTGISVKSNNTPADNVVAPGTKNVAGLKYSLNGTPEVAGKITTTISYENIYLVGGTYGIMVALPTNPTNVVTAENFSKMGTLYTYDNVNQKYVVANSYVNATTTYYTLEDYVVLANTYYPVEYAMAGTKANYNTDNTGYDQGVFTDTLAGVIGVMDDALGTIQGSASLVDGKTTTTWVQNFNANDNLADVLKIADSVLTWKWDMCNNTTECTAGDASCNMCKADTILANLQVEGNTVVKLADDGSYVAPTAASGTDLNDYNLKTSFSIDITVEQVD
ncbi:MAG: hypothetical protein IJ021_00255 [Clostridia bacterium]|nr:hypothetical protein [Clostridia bacterium]